MDKKHREKEGDKDKYFLDHRIFILMEAAAVRQSARCS